MKVKRTPGPWIAGFVETGWGIASRSIAGKCIVFVEKEDGGTLPSEADSKLLEAAPELLEACKTALLALEYKAGIFRSSDADAIRLLQNAISKAEGPDA